MMNLPGQYCSSTMLEHSQSKKKIDQYDTQYREESIMKLRKQVTVIAGLLLLSLLIGKTSAQEVRKKGKYWIGSIEKTFQVTSDGKLIMDDIRGDVTVQSWDQKKVKISEVKIMDISLKNEAISVMKEAEKDGFIQDGNIIRVGGPAFDRRWIQSKFNVFVPDNFDCKIGTKGGDLKISDLRGDVKASTGGGDVLLNGVDGTVTATTGGGDIDIEKTQGTVTATTGGGDVDITDAKGPITATTGGGDITVAKVKDKIVATTGGGDVDITETDGTVKVSTGGGDVDISVKGVLSIATGGGDVEALDIQGSIKLSTGGGDIDAEITLKDYSVDHAVTISSGGGDISLTLPSDLPATVDAEIKYRKKWEDYKITSDFPLKITQETDGKYTIVRAEGKLNGGGDLIKIRTGGGNIKIRK
jgi:DUF4097 and DUF4098 domain-containing protein YvlB